MVTTAGEPRTSYRTTSSSSDTDELLTQDGLEHLAGRVARQPVDELHASRHLVVGDAWSAEGDDVRRLQRGPRRSDDEREPALAEALVRQTDDGRFGFFV